MATQEGHTRDLNLTQLSMLLKLLLQLSPSQYTQSASLPHAPTIGRHSRHIIEHYQQLLAAENAEHIDYADRDRDPTLECQLSSARNAINAIIRALQEISLPNSYPLTLRANDQLLQTTWGRELEFVHSHTVHHLALMHIIVTEFDIDVTDTLGIHPTTLEYQRQCAQ